MQKCKVASRYAIVPPEKEVGAVTRVIMAGR